MLTEKSGDDFLARQSGESERSDELLSAAGHDNLNVELFLLKAAHQFRGLICSDSARDSESDAHQNWRCSLISLARLFFRAILRFRHLIFEKSLLHFFFRD